MIVLFNDLFSYNHHFNTRLLDMHIKLGDNTPGKIIQLLNHVINAHCIWNNRLDSAFPISGVWDIRAPQELKQRDLENYHNSLELLTKLDFNEVVSYQNTKGQSFQNTVRDMHFHIINHSTHHRAQISTVLKELGIEPPVSDYIFYKRK